MSKNLNQKIVTQGYDISSNVVNGYPTVLVSDHNISFGNKIKVNGKPMIIDDHIRTIKGETWTDPTYKEYTIRAPTPKITVKCACCGKVSKMIGLGNEKKGDTVHSNKLCRKCKIWECVVV